MAKALVELIGDASSFSASLKTSIRSVSTFKTELRSLNVDVAKSAEAQVKASALRVSRVREEIAAVKQLASTYRTGSEEQIAAMNLVARKQAELARLQGVTASRYGAGRRGGSLRRDERQASGILRGGIEGAGVSRLGLAALAGGGFFTSLIGTQAIRSTIDAATEANAVERQLAAQYKASGESLGAYRKQIDETLARESALAGFNKDELTQSYIAIFRAAGNTSSALRDESIAVDLARGRHMDLQAAALLVAKVINGNVGLLKRYGIETYKGETATQALAAIQAKYAGQARAGTTAQQRFSAELHNSEVIIGQALLPTVTHLLAEGAKWLDQMNRSGRLQKDVNTVVHDAAVGIHLLGEGAHYAHDAIKLADDVTGSFKNTLEVLIGLKIGMWALGVAGDFGKLRTAESGAAGQASVLQGRLKALKGIGTILVTVAVAFEIAKGGQALSKWLGTLGIPNLGDTPLPKGVSFEDVVHLAADQKKGRLSSRDQQVLKLLLAQKGKTPADIGVSTSPTTSSAEAAAKAAHGRAASAAAPTPTRAKPAPIYEYALPRNLQNALAAATGPAEDKKAAQAALDYTQKLIDSGRLVGQAYTDAVKERKKLYAEIAADAKKLAGPRGGSGGSLLPALAQEDLAKAQANAAAKSLPGLRALLTEQEKALATLKAEHQVGAARVRQLKEEAQLAVKIAATRREIAKTEAAASKASDAKKAEAILGLTGRHAKTSIQQQFGLNERGILNTALAQHVFGSKASKAQIAAITKKTADLPLGSLVDLVKKDLGDKLPKATLDSLEKINRVLKLKLLPPDVLSNLRSRLSQIKQTLLGGLADIGGGYQAYKGVSSYQFVHGIPGLSRAQKIALEERYSQVEAHGGMAVGTAAAGIVVPAAGAAGTTIHLHNPTFNGVQHLDQLIAEIKQRTRHENQRRGNRR